MHRPSLRLLASATALVLGASVLAATPAQAADPVEIQLLGINDFHGRIWSAPSNQLAALMAGRVNQLRAANPNTVFLSSGDNIGASTFESFISNDNPTIDALNAAGLEVSAVGNHEFDQGFAALLDRIPVALGGTEDPATDLHKTEFPYLGANVYAKGTSNPLLPEYTVIEKGGVKLGFVGAVTQETTSLVSPAGITMLDFGDPLVAINRVAAQLSDGNEANGEADVVIALVHDGSNSTNCATIAAEPTHFGDLVRGASADVDVIFSAHTHMLYSCEIGGRPVVQAASYAANLAKVVLTVDTGAGTVSATSEVLPLPGTPAPAPDPTVKTIVDAAVAAADEVGALPVGAITADITRAYLPGTTTEDRGSESSLGSLVADMQLWATSENPNYGGAPTVMAFMNPGGLRADLKYGADGTVSYKQAAVVQPFANTLVTMTLTGAQIRKVLEEQWQPPSSSRPRLALGISKGLSYTYLADAERYSHVVDITFNGAPLDEEGTYRVVVNSFLASGGDNFATLAEGVDKLDSGQVDLQAAVDYFAAHPSVAPPALGRSVLNLLPLTNETAPSIEGTVAVGQTVDADPGTWSRSDLTYAYQWNLDGVAIDGATASSYLVPDSAFGKELSVTVTASRYGYTTTSADSAAAAVEPGELSNLKAPSIAGAVAVGKKVTADPGSWSESGLAYAYQWKLDGVAIDSATASSYTVPASALGKQLSVTVTASRDGYVTAAATSAAVKVQAAAIANLKAPKITGTVAVGEKVKVDSGTWSESGLKYAYQWKLNGKAIKGATSPSYKVAKADKGKKLSVTVTVSKAGYTSASATSSSVTVKAKLIKNTSKPKITGTVKVGKVVKANPGTWSEKKVKFSYTWKVDGKKVGSGKSLKIPATAKGKQLTVTVKVSKSGFTPAYLSSKAVKVAKR